MKYVKYIACILVLIGAFNWGLVGIFDFDLVAALFGEMTIMSRIVYSLVGISAVITLFIVYHCKINKQNNCESGSCKY